MGMLTFIYLTIIALTACLARRPALDLPIDEDFATFTYIARFSGQGLKWRRDAFLFLFPVWRLRLLDMLYGNPETGVRRVRRFLTAQHAVTSCVVYGVAAHFSGNPHTALVAGLLYAFFATTPCLESDSINFEPAYLPFLLAALALTDMGPVYQPAAGVLLGLTLVTKLTTVLYLPLFMIWEGMTYGTNTLALFTGAALIPVLLAFALDAALGYVNAESIAQIRTRMAVTLRCAGRTALLPRLWGDLRTIVKDTLPVWALGLPSLFILFFTDSRFLFIGFTVVTLAMILFQRGFSRYHYLPLLGLLAMAGGVGLDRIFQLDTPWSGGFVLVFGGLLAASLVRLWPFYAKPLAPSTLARYGKFEQLIYLPYVGAVLRRLLRRKGETGQRIFVWGNFVQLYHTTGSPAADTYVHYAVGPWDDPALAGFFDAVIGGLVTHRPLYLIQAYPDLDLGRLETLTGLKYRLMKVMLARYPVYRLMSYKPTPIEFQSLPVAEKLRWMERLTPGRHHPGIHPGDLETGRPRRALAECKKMLRMNPNDRDGWIFLAELYSHLGQPDQGIALLKPHLSREPHRPRLRLLMARLNLQHGAQETAEELVHEEILRFGLDGETHWTLALLNHSRGDTIPALKHIEQACELMPTRWDIVKLRADWLSATGATEAALELYQTIWGRATETVHQGLRCQAAVALAESTSSPRMKLESLRRYREQAPENPWLAYAYASALEAQNREKEADGIFASLTERCHPIRLQAAAWFRRARLSTAESQAGFLRTCLRLDPTHRAAREQLGALEDCHARA